VLYKLIWSLILYGDLFVEEDEDATTPSPARLFYDIEVRLVNLGDGYKAPLPGSLDFQDISNTISGSFSPALEKVPGFHQLNLSELRKYVHFS
jgi:hypothetical protein